jgi:hypothetical protein
MFGTLPGRVNNRQRPPIGQPAGDPAESLKKHSIGKEHQRPTSTNSVVGFSTQAANPPGKATYSVQS